MIAASRRKEISHMKTFTIDAENNITVYASKKEAAAASTNPFDPLTSQDELTELAADWPMARLVEIWNGIPGVNAVTKFTSRKVATERIWKAIQGLGDVARPIAEPEAPAAEPEQPAALETAEAPAEPQKEPVPVPVADVQDPPETPTVPVNAEPATTATVTTPDAQAPDAAPEQEEQPTEPARARKAPRAPKVPKVAKTESGPREGSKTAQVVEMLQRESGATLAEIMEKMSWQKHTVRGFIAGAMKKAGYKVESFKPEGGERFYRISK